MRFIQRKSIRLKQYDYSKQGMYFITICTQNRECILSNIENVENVGVDAHIDPRNTEIRRDCERKDRRH